MILGLVSHYFFGITIFLTSLFLILLVLVQRGRGGGIAGALGGAGGQSAFGTRAGDLFTKITVGVASVWIVLCCLAIYFLKTKEFTTGAPLTKSGAISAPATGGDKPAASTGGPSSATTSDTVVNSQPATETDSNAPATTPAAAQDVPATESTPAPADASAGSPTETTPAEQAPATNN